MAVAAAAVGAVALAVLTGASPLHAQQNPTGEPPAADSVQVQGDEGVTPGDAFLRGLLIPGWGHASIGSYTRGGLYFAAETGTLWAFLRTRERLSEARERVDFREGIAIERLDAAGVTDPVAVADSLDLDPTVRRARSLVDAREQQRQDWVALGIFLVFLGGVDAFVSAHLQDFPQPVQADVRPLPNGRMEVGLRVPVGGW